MVALLFIPVAAMQALWVQELLQRSKARRGLVVAAGLLGILPAVAGLLFVFAYANGVLAPVSVPAGLLLLATVLALGAVAVWSLDRFVPRERVERVLAMVLAIPLLVVGVTFLVPAWEPGALYGWSGFQVLLGVSALLLGGVAPWLVAFWNERGNRWDRVNAAALVALVLPLALVAGLVVTIGVSAGDTTPADYAWKTTVHPAEEDASWVVEVPFFVVSPRAVSDAGNIPISHAVGVLEALQDRVEVTSGEARLTFSEDASRLRIEGEGDVTVEASIAFWGSPTAFHAWRLQDANVSNQPSSMGDVLVGWVMELDGNSCLATANHALEVAPGTVETLEDQDEDVNRSPVRLASPWSVACS